MATDYEKRGAHIIPSGETEGFKELEERKERERIAREEARAYSLSRRNPHYSWYHTQYMHALLLFDDPLVLVDNCPS